MSKDKKRADIIDIADHVDLDEMGVPPAKKINREDIISMAKELDHMETTTILINGQAFEFNFYKEFKKSRIYTFLDDVMDFLSTELDDESFIELSTPYISLLIIKHFTDIEIPDDLDEAMDYLQAMIDLEMFEDVIDSLPDSEIDKTYNLMKEALDRVSENISNAEEASAEASKEVSNKVVMEHFNIEPVDKEEGE